MVVVIDDRQDVWGDCPNLVKVVPCKPHSPPHIHSHVSDGLV